MESDELAVLYARYGYGVYRRCIAYLGVSEAPEAMRAVFVRALRGLGPARGNADPRTWLCRITDALCEEQLRGNETVEPAASTEASGFVSTMRAAPSAAEAEALERAVAADDLDALYQVQRLLPRLAPELRRLAVLYYLDELTEEELARELGWSRRNVGKRLQQLHDRARATWSERASAHDPAPALSRRSSP